MGELTEAQIVLAAHVLRLSYPTAVANAKWIKWHYEMESLLPEIFPFLLHLYPSSEFLEHGKETKCRWDKWGGKNGTGRAWDHVGGLAGSSGLC